MAVPDCTIWTAPSSARAVTGTTSVTSRMDVTGLHGIGRGGTVGSVPGAMLSQSGVSSEPGMKLMAISGIRHLSRAWRILTGAAFIVGLQLYLGRWWLDDGNEPVLTGFFGLAVIALLTANSIGHAFWLWSGTLFAMGIMLLVVLKSNIWPIVLVFGGAIMGAGVLLGWAVRELITWAVQGKKGRAV